LYVLIPACCINEQNALVMSDTRDFQCITWEDELSVLRSNVSDCLKIKSVFLKWDEESPLVSEVITQVDENGFFLSYVSDLEKETASIDLSQINDIRFCMPKEKARETLESYSSEPLQDRSFAIVYGSSLVDVNFLRLSSWSVDMAMVCVVSCLFDCSFLLADFLSISFPFLPPNAHVMPPNAHGTVPFKRTMVF